MYNLCIKCRIREATIQEPCCGAPDCVDVVYLLCAPCADEQDRQDMESYYDWLDSQDYY